MPELELLVQNLIPENIHRDFRLWLTSMPSPHFPISILQNSSKMTVEPPRGIQANMLRAYMNHVSDFKSFMDSADPKVPAFRLLQFALCLFHSVCLERRKFGPLGFNIPYEFTDGDLRICLSQLKMFLLEYDDVPFKVLQFTAGEINYGGRVTDDWDRRCIKNLLNDFYDSKVLDEDYCFDKEEVYCQLPVETSLAEYVVYIRTLPLNDPPAIFGLHENADISCAQAETFSCLATLLQLQPRAIGSDTTPDQEVMAVQEATAIDQAVPPAFDLIAVSVKYPVLYEESLNTVLVQEVIRYNKLLNMIHDSISKMLHALKGLVVMSEDLENMSQSIINNTVPHMWETLAYPSLKPLGAWVKDLQKRVQFVQKWIDDSIPAAFWISGFYFPQAFLTGTLQNFARKHVMSIDTINFTFKILNTLPTERPEDGCCIYGLYLEGCRWSSSKHILVESRPKELYTDMAVMWLIPEQHYQKPSMGIYECPVYKTLTRAGVLSTTGHSTNYVLTVEIPSDQPQKHWIKRGVALICALDY